MCVQQLCKRHCNAFLDFVFFYGIMIYLSKSLVKISVTVFSLRYETTKHVWYQIDKQSKDLWLLFS